MEHEDQPATTDVEIDRADDADRTNDIDVSMVTQKISDHDEIPPSEEEISQDPNWESE